MKTTLIIISLLITLIIVSFFVLGKLSKSGNAEGLINDKLKQCPDKPNCVCSEYKNDTEHFIAPLVIPDNSSSAAMTTLKDIIVGIKGNIETANETYISATFTSALFGFVDDLELRVDAKQNVIHIRSASRVGNNDLGANKKRVELIKTIFLEKTSKDKAIYLESARSKPQVGKNPFNF